MATNYLLNEWPRGGGVTIHRKENGSWGGDPLLPQSLSWLGPMWRHETGSPKAEQAEGRGQLGTTVRPKQDLSLVYRCPWVSWPQDFRAAPSGPHSAPCDSSSWQQCHCGRWDTGCESPSYLHLLPLSSSVQDGGRQHRLGPEEGISARRT